MCFAEHKEKNGLTIAQEGEVQEDALPPSTTSKSQQQQQQLGLLEAFDGNAYRASNTLLQAADWSLGANTRVFWLGSLAWTGNWKNYPYRNGTLLAAAAQRIQMRQYSSSSIVKDSGSGTGLLSSSADSSASAAGAAVSVAAAGMAGAQCKVSTTCHHYSNSLSQLSSRRHTGSNGHDGESPLRHDAVSLYTYNTGMEALACAPSVVIAGFMKSATSFLFHALTRHPSVLPALKGSQHKETYCYAQDKMQPDKLLSRSWCYPFVEEHEQFITIDGTVSYNLDQLLPATIKEVTKCK